MADGIVYGFSCFSICHIYLFLLIHLQHFVDILAAVAESWYLMLSAKFTFRLQPVVEKIGAGLHNLQMLKRDILVALGFVVAVYLLQLVVEKRCELVEVSRFF